METINKEYQETIKGKIETAFNTGSGDYFMQRNNFDEIIAVSEYEIEEKQSLGFAYFSFHCYKRGSDKPVNKTLSENNLKHIAKEQSNNSDWTLRDEFPDFYNNCGL